jgi:endonuclease III
VRHRRTAQELSTLTDRDATEETLAALKAKARRIYHLLVETHGEPAWEPGRDPVSQVVTTILSQSTTDTNQHRAFQQLTARYPTWDAVLEAPLDELEETIRIAGLAQQRAPRIKAALAYIRHERGAFSLDFLRDLPIDEAKAWLTRMVGVGPKTAAIVLLFSLGMPAFPVDTHVHRVSRRLGLVPPNATAPTTQDLLEALVDPSLYYPFHMNLIAHGRTLCKAQSPRCEACPLGHLCDDYQERRGDPSSGS